MRVQWSKALSLLSAFIVCNLARADVLYTYQGATLRRGKRKLATDDYVQGFVTFAAPLPPDTFSAFIPTDFSFSDGIHTITKAEADAFPPNPIDGSPNWTFLLGTDAQGLVYQYFAFAYDGTAFIQFVDAIGIGRDDEGLHEMAQEFLWATAIPMTTPLR